MESKMLQKNQEQRKEQFKKDFKIAVIFLSLHMHRTGSRWILVF